MSSLRSFNNLKQQCQQRNAILSEKRKGRREIMLASQRIVSVIEDESPRLSPRGYEERYRDIYEQLNENKLEEKQFNKVLEQIYNNSSRQNHPPFTEMFMCGVIYKLTQQYILMNIRQKQMFLGIIQNITGFDSIYNNELIKYNIFQILMDSLNENELIGLGCGCLCNLLLDSPLILKYSMENQLPQRLLKVFETCQKIPYSLIWLIRCISSKVHDEKILTSFLPLTIRLLTIPEDKTKTTAFVILGEIVTNNINVISNNYLITLLRFINFSCEVNDSAITAALRLLRNITSQVYCEEIEELCLNLFLKNNDYSSLTTRRLILDCVNNVSDASQSFSEKLFKSSTFCDLPSKTLSVSDETLRLSLTRLTFQTIIKSSLGHDPFSIEEKVALIKMVTLTPIDNQDLLMSSLHFLQFLLQQNLEIEDICQDNSLRDWFDHLLISKQQDSVKQLSQALSCHIFLTNQMEL
ncbi:hypothetical protein KM1_062820 [Entamoeba histolytica HM-3:IMSS]|uniref:Importin alpha n=4 Tax=Entamoeba histolytica TaxID=5759 RepID=C4LU23_ENTH1|nr:hypothetical protein EHI_068300 [Entamoeba histolytica HM-1:IMSS]EAL48754.1 hypothetical protein EHI_068300 [Entamoeba histolytica HM-1:IMSS]EMD42973.1 Hypothetical protein EHI5A_050820 [Entamoeba histolytica KU27]EMS13456.1 hypothetical protein KM1_062820 [Entamoeba histolytica HM-3:IMSS]GAT92090.1 hypothetical protein CL6EHI_068300 [Entamoeba histolytica]|eukprot:XP_654141.1 hypothetical protein EHI_068300 [Entamoeba histolytica HM-1:IMSS]